MRVSEVRCVVRANYSDVTLVKVEFIVSNAMNDMFQLVHPLPSCDCETGTPCKTTTAYGRGVLNDNQVISPLPMFTTFCPQTVRYDEEHVIGYMLPFRGLAVTYD